MNILELEFKRNINTQRLINTSGAVKRVMEKLAPTKDDSGRATFSEQVANLEAGLAIEGVYPLTSVYRLKELYLQKRGSNEGAYPSAMLHYSRVFNAVVNRALRAKAVTLSIQQAEEYDIILTELNKAEEEEFLPQERIGESWLPVSMASIAFVDEDKAGEWDLNSGEPYAGSSFLDSI